MRCKKCEREFEFPIYKPVYILRGKVVVDQLFVYPVTVIDGEVWQLDKSGVLEPACPYCECPVYEREGAVELMWTNKDLQATKYSSSAFHLWENPTGGE